MTEIRVATEALELLTGDEARDYELVPFGLDGEILCCYGREGKEYASVIMEAEVLTGKNVRVERLSREEFIRLLGRCYRQDKRGGGWQTGKPLPGGEHGFLHGLFGEACREGASDIHMEAYEGRCRIRFRIDGKLLERHVVDKGNYAALVNQVKILANLDISEKRLPQDGRILYNTGDSRFDVRVSSLPAIHGEKLVLRLLTQHAELLDLKNLGFSREQFEAYRSAIASPHGMVLISGPTGSGKSTTLYATLRLLNDITSNILTIEDPVEYTLEGVNQVQLKEEIGLTFTSALRTFLRQDPDVIMLGEIRDADTAQMAIRSSLTGHLIFSTIHTNSAWGCISRLVDMGVHPYLISDTLILCMAQRLVRLLCPECKVERTGGELPGYGIKADKLYRAAGCEHCYYTGYSGRKAIYEVIPIDGELAEAVRNGEGDVSRFLEERHIRTLRDSAVELLEQGMTSLEEVLPFIG